VNALRSKAKPRVSGLSCSRSEFALIRCNCILQLILQQHKVYPTLSGSLFSIALKTCEIDNERHFITHRKHYKIVFVFGRGSSPDPAVGAYNTTFASLIGRGKDNPPHSSPIRRLSLGVSVRAFPRTIVPLTVSETLPCKGRTCHFPLAHSHLMPRLGVLLWIPWCNLPHRKLGSLGSAGEYRNRTIVFSIFSSFCMCRTDRQTPIYYGYYSAMHCKQRAVKSLERSLRPTDINIRGWQWLNDVNAMRPTRIWICTMWRYT